MIRKDQFLHEATLDPHDLETAYIRDGFGQGLLEAGEENEDVVALCCDLTESTRVHKFKQKFPSRYVEVGVAEQNMATIAAGLAVSGKVPFTVSYAVFNPGRNWDQIRATIALNDVPVVSVGAHAGVSVGPDGATHQALEDIAIMRVLPNMTVIVPTDMEEARKATLAAAAYGKPVYLRLVREQTPLFTTSRSPFEIGKANLLFKPSSWTEVGIIATGAMVHNALLAAQELTRHGIPAMVLNMHTIKPLDHEAILDMAELTGAIVTAEEHQVTGGLGGAVAELLAQTLPVPIEFVGVRDQFGQSGQPAELVDHYNLNVGSIVEAARHVVARRDGVQPRQW